MLERNAKRSGRKEDATGVRETGARCHGTMKRVNEEVREPDRGDEVVDVEIVT
jgi:hypothetical protein